MSNTDAPRGFTPVRHLHGGTIRYQGGFTIASEEATAMYSGDLVSMDATRNNRDIALTADGAAEIVGVFAGCQYTAVDGSVVWSPYWAAATATKGGLQAEAFVYSDPGIVYEAQADGTLAVTAVGQFCDMVSTHAGSAVTGRSGEEIQASSASNDILQLKIIGLSNKVDGITLSDASSDFSRWECIIAEGEYVATLRSVS